MERQELFYPEIEVQVGDYVFDQGISLRIYSSRNAPMDWGKLTFSNPYKERITLKKFDEVVVRLGYSGSLQKVFIGNLIKGYDGTDSVNEIMFKDHMLLLETVLITDTYLSCTPQEIIIEGLRKAGITEYRITDAVYPRRGMFPVVRKNMIQLLKQINAAWGISVGGNFVKGVFYWGVSPEQTEILEFEYGSSIISLDRNKDMWELITVSVPSMQHSQKISVIHPKVTGIFTTEKIIFETNEGGFIRTKIYFKE